MIALAVLTVGLLGSCSKINERLDNLEKKVVDIETVQIASVKSQIDAIKASIADLGQIRSDIAALKESAEAHAQDIFDLQQADEALMNRILNLEDYLDNVLPKFAEKEWVEATFSTLEQYEATCDTIAKIDARIGALDARLSKEIKDCAEQMKTWVNEQLKAYYTAAEVDAKLALLKATIDSTREAGKATDLKVDSLATELTKLKASVDTAKANIRNEYKAAIKLAIEAFDAKMTKEITDKINAVNATVLQLTTRVTDLETKVNDLADKVAKLEKMIQVVTIFPEHEDGSVDVLDSVVEINLIVSPASAVDGLEEEKEKGKCYILVNPIAKTKAVNVDTIKFGKFKSFEVDKARGTVEILADIKAQIDAAGTDKVLTLAVHLENGISNYTTDFVKVYVPAQQEEKRYVEIGGKKWATMNLGATTVAGSYATCAGDLYQWGSLNTLYSSITWGTNSATFVWKDGKEVNGGFSEKNLENTDYKDLTYATDVVMHKLDAGWHTPKKQDFIDLINACWNDWDEKTPIDPIKVEPNGPLGKGIYWVDNGWNYWVKEYGVAGCLFVDEKGAKLFFPMPGVAVDKELMWMGSFAYYWTSKVSDHTNAACCLWIDNQDDKEPNGDEKESENENSVGKQNGVYFVKHTGRMSGGFVRPVRDY